MGIAGRAFGASNLPSGRLAQALGASLAGVIVLCLGRPGMAAEPAPVSPADAAFFEKEVRPILAERCFKCHGAEKQSGQLRLDGLASILAGGDSGPAVAPGSPDESLLVEAINHGGLKMPPSGKLAEREIATLTRWVRIGAPWPNTDAAAAKSARPRAKITDDDRHWWAFEPMRVVSPPEAAGAWARDEVDRFIAARLNESGLAPAPEASRSTLARRLYFDLWGLPPTPDEVEAFARDPASDAYERLVDRLLDSPRYGQRWATLWLDLVRYADSDGYRVDDYRPDAWRYRDYVIAAFNADKPYDRFVAEQLAGDELFPGDPEALVATGYFRQVIYEYNNRDVAGQWSVMLNDITDTTGDVFLGLGLQCARCHDHKFDPILQKDYYRLQAFFAPLLPRDDLPIDTAAEQEDYARRLAEWERETAPLRLKLAELEAPFREKAVSEATSKFSEELRSLIHKPVAERAPLEHQLAELAYRQVTYEFNRLDRKYKGEAKEKILALRKELAAFDKLKPKPLALTPAVSDVGPLAPPLTIPKKGDAPVEPGFPTVLVGMKDGEGEPAAIEPPAGLPNSTGRRAALARWLTRADNPLTARVIVNRIWAQHFGHGLAANTSDFGRLGEAPSHPELLDWLATRFVGDGWSVKRLHKLLVTSAAYRQSAAHPSAEAGRLKDPENRLLWRGGVRRFDAEQIRDALLAVTGELDPAAGGPGVLAGEPRRTVYVRFMRNTREPLLDAFDAPLRFNSAASRDSTTTPVQSLLLINGQTLLGRAKAFAARLERAEPSRPAERIRLAYGLVYGRAPSSEELAAAEDFVAAQSQRIEPEEAGSPQAAFLYGKIPFRDGRAALCDPDGPQRSFQVPHHASMPTGDFTIEAFVLPHSIYDTGQVRAVASKWSGDTKKPGWMFGVTGKGSRRKPQTLVLQVFGQLLEGGLGEQAVFSDQHIQLDKPYYIAAALKLAAAGQPGEVIFYAKDLSNDDEPLLVARAAHNITGGLANEEPLGLGGASRPNNSLFDGMIDDVRLSNAALPVEQLLFTAEGTNAATVGYWEFETRPDVFGDSSGHALSIQPAGQGQAQRADTRAAAWVDFCHVLLNSSEFLYVQ